MDTGNGKNTVWKNIDTVRKERHISKKDLSKMTGMTMMSVSRHTTGRATMTVDSVIRYAEALGCSPADFFEGAFDRTRYSVETGLEHMYPYNFACAVISCGEDLADDERQKIAYGTYAPGLLDIMDKILPEKEKQVVEYRFRNLMTLEEAGKQLGVSGERARQLEQSALRKMRWPGHRKKWDIRDMSKIIGEARKYRKAEEENEKLRDELRKCREKLSAANGTVTPAKVDGSPGMDVDELGLSVRAYNCLLRYGIRKAGTVTLLSMDDLACVRNLGEKSTKEIRDALREHGMELCTDGRQSAGTIGTLRLSSSLYRPYIVIALRGAGIYTLEELSGISKSELADIVGRLDAPFLGPRGPVILVREIVNAASKAGIAIC